MGSFEDRIRAMTAPRHGAYPRPWTTDTDPEQADVLIVGASSAKTFRVEDVCDHDRFIDSLWNRNGQSCRAVYAMAVGRQSRTRPNLDRLSAMLAARGLSSLQTNVSCASAPYDAHLTKADRAHGTEIFKLLVAHLPWRAMIVHGAGAVERFGRTVGPTMPDMPPTDAAPAWVMVDRRPVFIAPTLAPPGYRRSVWTYLEKVVALIADSTPPAHPIPSPAQHIAATPIPQKTANERPDAFFASAANLLAWRRMREISETSSSRLEIGEQQASLFGGQKYASTTRFFRHKFKAEKPDLLLRADVFDRDRGLLQDCEWVRHKTAAFWNIRTDDLLLLDRILDAVQGFAAHQ